MTMPFNPAGKLAPLPREITDPELLAKVLAYLPERDDSQEEMRDTFTGWLNNIKTKKIKCLKPRDRGWVNSVLDRYEPRVANLVSRGLVPRGREVPTPAVLRDLPKHPPGRKRLYRVFSNDRRRVKGVPMYSCLMETSAATPEAAISQANPAFGAPKYAPIVAIEWPPETQVSKDWLAKHVEATPP